MSRLMDKGIILLLCAVLLVQSTPSAYAVVPLLCALIAACAADFHREPVTVAAFCAYCAAAALFSDFIYFLPLICYDFMEEKRRRYLLLAAVPIVICLPDKGQTVIMISLFCAVSCLMEYRTQTQSRRHTEFTHLRDAMRETSLQLERKNRELREKQDYEVHVATLAERNRIAREIHDSVGHVLSRAILQTGALLAVCRDAPQKDGLSQLRVTLQEGMDSIRASVHALYDDSIDLLTELKTLLGGFLFCPVTLDYDADNAPPKEVRLAFIAIVKEALSNVTRHSDASAVRVTVREHPALYQLVITDNGHPRERSSGGIGLSNMTERVKSLNGVISISDTHGFQIFISVPKGETAR